MLIKYTKREIIVLQEIEGGSKISQIAKKYHCSRGKINWIRKKISKKQELGEKMRKMGFPVTEIF